MYRAVISLQGSSHRPVLGPTDTRDAAARLAQAWIETHCAQRGDRRSEFVEAVDIEEVTSESAR